MLELTAYASNHADLYRQRTQPIILNQARRIINGTFDAAKAPAIWRYLADDAAQRYTREFAIKGGPSYGCFTIADRKAAALELMAYYADEVQETATGLRELAADRKAARHA